MPAAPGSSASAAEGADELPEEVPAEHGGTMAATTSEDAQGTHLSGEGDGAPTFDAPAGGVSPASRVAPSLGKYPSPPSSPGGGGAEQPRSAPERAATSAAPGAVGAIVASSASCLRESERALPLTCGSHYVIGRFRLTACDRPPVAETQ
mmetsp:Transcript_12536/g.33273  ORF Transcript_12536/g.33273 Transcript_12536/m.33273 type:complete len:150 (+) Transcript_12536:107-556(+)